jgi:hypothetical protein
MLPMTRHKALHTGLASPSPLDRLINALLHAFAMLVSHAAKLCSMRLTRCPAECHSDATPEVLPRTESGKLKKTTQAAASSHIDRPSKAREALMVSSVATATRPSNHEGGLIALSASHSRASEARPENLWAARGSPTSALAASRILGSLRSGPQGRFGPVDQIERRRPGQGPRMTRRWVCWDNHQARLAL